MATVANSHASPIITIYSSSFLMYFVTFNMFLSFASFNPTTYAIRLSYVKGDLTSERKKDQYLSNVNFFKYVEAVSVIAHDFAFLIFRFKKSNCSSIFLHLERPKRRKLQTSMVNFNGIQKLLPRWSNISVKCFHSLTMMKLQ